MHNTLHATTPSVTPPKEGTIAHHSRDDSSSSSSSCSSLDTPYGSYAVQRVIKRLTNWGPCSVRPLRFLLPKDSSSNTGRTRLPLSPYPVKPCVVINSGKHTSSGSPSIELCNEVQVYTPSFFHLLPPPGSYAEEDDNCGDTSPIEGYPTDTSRCIDLQTSSHHVSQPLAKPHPDVASPCAEQKSMIPSFCSRSWRLHSATNPNVSSSLCGGESSQLYTALAEWAADFLYTYITMPDMPWGADVSRSVPRLEANRRQTIDRIDYLLSQTAMPSQAVFLSLWYISSLPLSLSTTGLLRDEQGYSFLWHLQGDLLPNPDLEVLISRLFLVGAMLADKWLDDLTVITKSWSRLSHIPITTLNNLEWAALQIFGYSLHISPSSWSAWLHKLLDYHSSVARLYPVSRARDSGYTLICNCLGQALEACRVGPLVTSPPAPSATPPPMLACQSQDQMTPFPASSNRNHILLGSPDHQLPATFPRMCVQEDITRLGQPHFLPPPATWSPNDDPIFIAPKRKVGMAPGTIPIQRSAGAHVQPSSINRDPLADHLGVVLIDGIQHPTDAFTFGLPLLSQPISWLRGRP